MFYSGARFKYEAPFWAINNLNGLIVVYATVGKTVRLIIALQEASPVAGAQVPAKSGIGLGAAPIVAIRAAIAKQTIRKDQEPGSMDF